MAIKTMIIIMKNYEKEVIISRHRGENFVKIYNTTTPPPPLLCFRSDICLNLYHSSRKYGKVQYNKTSTFTVTQ